MSNNQHEKHPEVGSLAATNVSSRHVPHMKQLDQWHWIIQRPQVRQVLILAFRNGHGSHAFLDENWKNGAKTGLFFLLK